MEIKVLRNFIEVARLGSFAAVARKYDLDASSVSRMVANLEAELNVRLLQRTTRSHALTEAGTRYLSYIEPLIDELEKAGDQANWSSTEPNGCLRLAASVAFGQECLVPLIREFRAQYPSIDLELILSDSNVDLVKENIDLSIRLGRHIDQDMISTKLMTTRYRVFASPRYLSENGQIEWPRDLSQRDCILFTNPDFRSKWQFKDQSGEHEEISVRGSIRVSNPLALRAMLLQGLGPGLLADWMTEKEREEGTLVDLFPNHRVTATNFDTGAWLIYPSRSYLPHKVRVMIDFLKQRLG